ncbi:GmrSD restriction endonuclease domain-containing protein [Oribacterium sp. NK2B42]|uniref:GmrSD restriction endonuclease domain-containing protein n=1 Tax=Oribacterium sp. NK2B42 TaxID=689781 RepID=UPI000422AEEC|nr:DUF262 domain-containing protein [Oribacterium sp. NK2B42]
MESWLPTHFPTNTIDINKCPDPYTDREDAILSIPDDKQLKSDFNRKIDLDLSTRELEYKNEMFPVNIIFDNNEREDWADGYKDYYDNSKEAKEKYKRFRTEVLDTIVAYKLPVITLKQSTPREAVCKVFENVNTGGVPLTVFELVTATFATYGFDLREDWIHKEDHDGDTPACSDIIWGKYETLKTDVMDGIDETMFLQTITLYTNFIKTDVPTSCKRRDVLALAYDDYKNNKAAVLEGFKMARKFLMSQYVFRQRDLPYASQIIPLAAICAVIGNSKFNQPKTQDILAQWFWCGILGEMYGGANETKYAYDIEDVVNSINGQDSQNRTVNSSFFSSTRLLSMQSRQSAAYKGIMALVYRAKCEDLMNGTTMDIVKSMDESPDIHHIFPQAYCINQGYDRSKWNSIVNKTPLLPSSNRAIGGKAPSIYTAKIKKDAGIEDYTLRHRFETHLVNYDALVADDFDSYFIDRAKKILNVVESAMGKAVSDKESEQTVKAFGVALV